HAAGPSAHIHSRPASGVTWVLGHRRLAWSWGPPRFVRYACASRHSRPVCLRGDDLSTENLFGLTQTSHLSETLRGCVGPGMGISILVALSCLTRVPHEVGLRARRAGHSLFVSPDFHGCPQLMYNTKFMGEPTGSAAAHARPQRKLVRVSPRGFCAGVVRAVEIVERALELFRPPVYVHHEIVHNRYVVDQPRNRSLRVIDATCPLVTKVHMEALRFARESRTIILIGHRDHQEIIGTSGEAPDRTLVVGSVEEVDRLEVEDPDRLAFLTQTTLSLYDTQEIVARLRQRFPNILGPASDDICYATQNRQEAVEQIGKEVDLILVVGSANSSNSNRLVEVSQRGGTQARLIEDANDIDPVWLEGVGSVGLTAGASAPEVLVQQVSERLASLGFSEQSDLDFIREDVRFTLPPELVSIVPAAAATGSSTN